MPSHFLSRFKYFLKIDTKVNINGNQYTARFVNGKATIDANLDPDKEYDLEVMIGGEPVKYKYKAASGEKDENQDSKTSQNSDGTPGSSGTSQTSADNAYGTAKGNGNTNNETSNSAHFSTNKHSGVYGTNASGSRQD